jgi:hypothetical protein
MAKKVGRPTSEIGIPQTHKLQMRVSTEFLAKLDKWRGMQPNPPSRTEAIRRLVEHGLAAAPAPRSDNLVARKLGLAPPPRKLKASR